MQRRSELSSGESKELKQRHTISLSCHKEAEPPVPAISRFIPTSVGTNTASFAASFKRQRYGVAYLFGFFCTVINESPSADEGDGGLSTGAVGMGVGLSPSIERGEEG